MDGSTHEVSNQFHGPDGADDPFFGMPGRHRSRRPSPAPSLSAVQAQGADTLTSGSDVLIVTRAEVVFGEIELKPVDEADCTASACEEEHSGAGVVQRPAIHL